MITTIQNVLSQLETFAPYELAESWDNVGLLVGDRKQEITRVLCALDVTQDVVQEAIDTGAQLIVAHHPAIFTSVHTVIAGDPTGDVLRALIQNDIGAICMHTNADCTWGGVNDALAEALGLQNIQNLELGENKMLGRFGELVETMQPAVFARYVKEKLQAGGVRYANGGKPIRRVAVGGGACGKMMDDALRKGADAFVIGDSSYDLMQRAEALGLTLVDAGHFPTENPVAAVFAAQIQKRFPALQVSCSQVHQDCVHFI